MIRVTRFALLLAPFLLALAVGCGGSNERAVIPTNTAPPPKEKPAANVLQ